MNIKKGDLVMVVKPSLCCGNTRAIGLTFVALDVVHKPAQCLRCGYLEIKTHVITEGTTGVDIARLKKIDPPSEGDSLPTRKELEVTA